MEAAAQRAMAGEAAISRWWRVVGGLSMNLALGALYAWSVFVAPLEEKFGWDRTQTSTVFTIAVVVFALSFVVAGRLQDRLGPFPISVTGAVLITLAFIMSSFTTSLIWLYIWFGVVGGLGNGFGYATPIPVMAKWFPDRRGLAVGLAVAGYGGGSAIFGPVAKNWLIPTYGVNSTFAILGVVFFVMTIIGAFLLRNPPVGYKPAGWEPAPAARAAATVHEFAPGETVRTPAFYFMWVAYALGATAGLMVISQLVPFAESKGLSAAIASTALIVGAVGNAAGRILSGALSDAIGRLNTLRLMIGISAVAVPIMYNVTGTFETGILFLLLVFIVYWCYGTQLSVNASTTSDFWGTKNAGINYGLLFTAWGVAGIIGPRLGGQLFDRFGNYQAAFYIAGLLAVVALLSEFLARRPQVPAAAPAAQPATGS
ncbi:MAG TPA: OFA family MFS transporter [Actinomycetota bacterium]|nr:OFA family MFS transporter [Actinomycetota bacterium]